MPLYPVTSYCRIYRFWLDPLTIDALTAIRTVRLTHRCWAALLVRTITAYYHVLLGPCYYRAYRACRLIPFLQFQLGPPALTYDDYYTGIRQDMVRSRLGTTCYG